MLLPSLANQSRRNPLGPAGVLGISENYPGHSECLFGRPLFVRQDGDTRHAEELAGFEVLWFLLVDGPNRTGSQENYRPKSLKTEPQKSFPGGFGLPVMPTAGYIGENGAVFSASLTFPIRHRHVHLYLHRICQARYGACPQLSR